MSGQCDNGGKAAVLYGRLAAALNLFFSRFTSVYCADCLSFHRESSPKDPIARHTVAEGAFPGCCQEGVAEDMRVHLIAGLRLPESLRAQISARRPARDGRAAPEYAVRDESDGKVHRGRGCVWLGPEGCVLGEWKSPICLSYLCPPLLAALSENSGAALGEDFLGLPNVFASICDYAEGRIDEAAVLAELDGYEERLGVLAAKLSKIGG